VESSTPVRLLLDLPSTKTRLSQRVIGIASDERKEKKGGGRGRGGRRQASHSDAAIHALVGEVLTTFTISLSFWS